MRQWFLEKTPRERLIVVAMTVTVLLALIYYAAIKPLTSGLAQRRVQVETKARDLEWAQAQVGQLRNAGVRPAVESTDKSPFALLDEAIRKHQLSTPQRVEPLGAQGARAVFERVELNALIAMLAELETRYGLRVSNITMTRKDPALAAVRVTLEAQS